MVNSIQHFCQDGVKNLEKVMVDYSSDMTKIAEMVQGVTKAVTDLGLSMIAEEWEVYDEMLRKKKVLRPEWYIVRRDETTLLTSLGSVTYHKTLFRNKHTGKYEYLLDRIMGNRETCPSDGGCRGKDTGRSGTDQLPERRRKCSPDRGRGEQGDRDE